MVDLKPEGLLGAEVIGFRRAFCKVYQDARGSLAERAGPE